LKIINSLDKKKISHPKVLIKINYNFYENRIAILLAIVELRFNGITINHNKTDVQNKASIIS